MWAHRTRRGAKNNDRASEENIIEIIHPSEGVMVYRPSSCVMPARPLGAPPEAPIIAPVAIKKEAEEDGTEASVPHAATEFPIPETSEMPVAPPENASEDCVRDIEVKKEPPDIPHAATEFPIPEKSEISVAPPENASQDCVMDVEVKTEPANEDIPDNRESAVSDNVESSAVNKKIASEAGKNSTDSHEDTEVDSSDKQQSGQNTLDMWDLESMFSGELFSKTYLEYLDQDKTDAEECLNYLNSSFPNIKRNSLFCLEVPSKKNINSTAQHSAPSDFSNVDKTINIKKPVAPKSISFVSETPSLSKYVNSVTSTISSTEREKSGDGETTVEIKKEPLSPKSNSVSSETLPFSRNINSESFPVDKVAPIESSERKKLDDTDLKNIALMIKKEPVSPPKNLNNFDKISEKSKKSFVINNNSISKDPRKDVLAKNLTSTISLEKTTSELSNLDIADKPVTSKVLTTAYVENTNKRKHSAAVEETFDNLDCPPSKLKATLQNNRMDASCVSPIPVINDTPSTTRQSDSITSIRRVPVIDRFLHNKAQIPPVMLNPPNLLQETHRHEAPSKKIKLTPQEYLQRKSHSASSNSNISKYSVPQASVVDPMFSTDNSPKSGARDPRLQKSATPSISTLPSPYSIPPYEIAQNVKTSNLDISQSLKSYDPISRERMFSQERRCQNDIELQRDKSSSMKQTVDKKGGRFKAPSDVTKLILKWNVSWLEQQKKTLIVPPIYETSSYPEVKNTYNSLDSYYDTYFPLHLLQIWMSLYKSWERQDFLPDSTLKVVEPNHNFVKICCSMRLNTNNKHELPKVEDILICQVDGYSKKFLGKVSKVRDANNSLPGYKGKLEIDIICAESFTASSIRLIKLQKLNNIRIALCMSNALNRINPSMHSAILNPKHERSEIAIICAKPFVSHNFNKYNIQEIMRSIRAPHAITLVDTPKPTDSLKAITFLVPEVLNLGGLLFLCIKDEETFFQMATDFRSCDPVLAVKEADVPRLPSELAGYTYSRLKEQDRLGGCQLCFILMSAMFLGDLEGRLLRTDKITVCLVHEADSFTETETALLLEQRFKKLILLGRDRRIENMEARLKRQSFDKSLFCRIYQSCRV